MRSTVLLLAAAVAAAAPGVAGRLPAGPAAPARAQGRIDAAELRNPTTWSELAARDALCSFSASGAREARRALGLEAGARAPLHDPLARAAAWYALGAGGDVRDRPALAEAAATAAPPECLGAIHGLGALRPPPVEILIELGQAASADAAAAAAVALGRAGTPEARAALDLWRNDGGARGAGARAAQAWFDAPFPEAVDASPGPAVETLLALRWEAARAFGFVDGLPWRVHVEAELGRDDAFLDRVLLEAALDLRPEPLHDHLLALALAPGTPDRLRAAVRALPRELGRLHEAKLWSPADDAEWSAILDAIREAGPDPAYAPLLEAAAERESTRVQAGLLLVAAGDDASFGRIAGELEAPEPERRLAAAEALGGGRDRDRVPELSRLRRDPDPEVRAAALVALVRLGDQGSRDLLHEMIEAGPSDARSNAIAMLARASRDGVVQSYLETLLVRTDLREDQRVLCQVSLALQGRLQPRGALREMLALEGLGRGLQELIVRALARNPDRDDLAALRATFPVDDSRSLNVALATALVRNGDPGGTGLLRQGLWRGPWSRSVLAGGVLVRHNGIHALHAELASPPQRASDADLRRVGYALGEWGGISEVDVLARRRRAGDPALQGAFLGALSTRTR